MELYKIIINIIVFTSLFYIEPKNNTQILLFMLFTSFIIPWLMGWTNPLLIYLKDVETHHFAFKILILSIIFLSVWDLKCKNIST